jgi:hypothetical protein
VKWLGRLLLVAVPLLGVTLITTEPACTTEDWTAQCGISDPGPLFRVAIDPAPVDRMEHSWRAGCPVETGDLRLLTMSHWGFDGTEHMGELVVHRDHAEKVAAVFKRLFDARFPVERMELVDVYQGDDLASMEANNTSGFNCRLATGSDDTWSEHAYGWAIDINPVQNPYVNGSTVLPDSGRAYLDRSNLRPGMVVSGDAAVSAFASIGWGWGGDWESLKDYQHFSATGR